MDGDDNIYTYRQQHIYIYLYVQFIYRKVMHVDISDD